MSHEKMSDFVSCPLFGFMESYFESHCNTLTFFDQKNDVRFEYALSDSVEFGLSLVV